MSSRIEKTWTVFESLENADRCVDLFERPDGSFGFEEFRRDVEAAGAWTPVGFHSGAVYLSREATLASGVAAVVWLSASLGACGVATPR